MTKRETLVQLLQRYDELAGAGTSSGNGSSGEPGAPMQAHDPGCHVYDRLTCTCWRQALAELDTRLLELRGLAPQWHHALVQRYRHRTIARKVNVRVRGGRWQGLDSNQEVMVPNFHPAKPPDRIYADVLVATWPEKTNTVAAAAGLDWLEQHYAGEPQLPAEAVAA